MLHVSLFSPLHGGTAAVSSSSHSPAALSIARGIDGAVKHGDVVDHDGARQEGRLSPDVKDSCHPLEGG